VQALREEEFFQRLGQPETGIVRRMDRMDGQAIGPGVPRYLVRSISYPVNVMPPLSFIKIVDFGQSFSNDECPSTINTPLPVRAPEIIFKDRINYRVDIWSMACLVSELSQPYSLGML
jgi:serine/threonine protein kinase